MRKIFCWNTNAIIGYNYQLGQCRCRVFFYTLKTKFIHNVAYKNSNEAEQSLSNYIEIYYNRRRIHSTNGYKSPADFENELINYRKVA